MCPHIYTKTFDTTLSDPVDNMVLYSDRSHVQIFSVIHFFKRNAICCSQTVTCDLTHSFQPHVFCNMMSCMWCAEQIWEKKKKKTFSWTWRLAWIIARYNTKSVYENSVSTFADFTAPNFIDSVVLLLCCETVYGRRPRVMSPWWLYTFIHQFFLYICNGNWFTLYYNMYINNCPAKPYECISNMGSGII